MMLEKEQQSAYPLAPTTTYMRSDEEAATADDAELRRKKRMKYLIYFAIFVVFQTGIIMLFALTVMKIKTPKFRVRSATFDSTFDVVATTNPSFNIRMNAELGVKNTNFGHYKYQNSTIEFYYKGTKVGDAFVPRARAKARSTKKFTVSVELVSTDALKTSELGNDLSSGILTLSSGSKLSGKVELMKVMKKKKSTNMNCTMQINIQKKELQNIQCK